jgi:predicted acetyltransferase
MVEIRGADEEHREQIARLGARTLNQNVEHMITRSASFHLEDFSCAFDGDEVVATSAAHPFKQWFGGKALDCAGVYAVSTSPEHRQQGLASAVVRSSFELAKTRGDVITSLYPAVLGPYRSLGYEVAGTFNCHHVPVDALPHASGARVKARLL